MTWQANSSSASKELSHNGISLKATVPSDINSLHRLGHWTMGVKTTTSEAGFSKDAAPDRPFQVLPKAALKNLQSYKLVLQRCEWIYLFSGGRNISSQSRTMSPLIASLKLQLGSADRKLIQAIRSPWSHQRLLGSRPRLAPPKSRPSFLTFDHRRGKPNRLFSNPGHLERVSWKTPTWNWSSFLMPSKSERAFIVDAHQLHGQWFCPSTI